MRCRKILGLLVVAAATTMAFAASASADYLSTSTGGPAATPTIHWVNENGHVSLHNPEANIECASTMSGIPTWHGAKIPVTGYFSSLSFTGCTNGWTVTVQTAGEFEIHRAAGHMGELVSTGMTLNASFFFGLITCRYRTFATYIGTITGGNPATLHLAATIPFHSGSEACGISGTNWTGNYQTTGALFVNWS